MKTLKDLYLENRKTYGDDFPFWVKSQQSYFYVTSMSLDGRFLFGYDKSGEYAVWKSKSKTFLRCDDPRGEDAKYLDPTVGWFAVNPSVDIDLRKFSRKVDTSYWKQTRFVI